MSKSFSNLFIHFPHLMRKFINYSSLIKFERFCVSVCVCQRGKFTPIEGHVTFLPRVCLCKGHRHKKLLKLCLFSSYFMKFIWQTSEYMYKEGNAWHLYFIKCFKNTCQEFFFIISKANKNVEKYLRTRVLYSVLLIIIIMNKI